MPRRSLQRMRDKIALGFYATTRHAEEEMYDDSLTEEDVETAINNGAVVRIQRDRLARRKYTVEGRARDGRTMRVICRFSDTGSDLVIITVYALIEPNESEA